NTDAGNYPAALDALQRALELAQATPGGEAEACALINLGNVYQELRNLDGAETRFTEGLRLARELRLTSLELIALENLAEVGFRRGDLAAAEDAYRQVLEASRQGGQMNTQVSALEGLARVHSAQGQPERALDDVRQALQLVEAAGDRNRAARLLLVVAETERANGRLVEARATLERAMNLAAELGAKRLGFECRDALAALAEQEGGLAEALESLKAARRLERELFNEEGERRLAALSMQYELERARADAEAYRRRTEETQKANATLEQRVRERTRELEEEQLETVVRLAEAAEYRDDSTGLHTQRVGQLSALIAEALGLPSEDVDCLRIAARLHDVGKIAIPDPILQKPGRLELEEFERVKTHTLIGARILSGGRSALLRAAERIALSHHERWDGSGYPHQLRGEAIPLFARIVAVADVYDALLSERPYKPAWSPELAREEIRALSGTSFDPKVVQAFLTVTGVPVKLEGAQDILQPLAERRRQPLGHQAPSPHLQALNAAWEARASDPERCRAETGRLLVEAREQGDRVAFAYAQRNLGFLEYAAAHYQAAVANLSEGLSAGQAMDDHVLTRDCHNYLGAAYSALGDYATAAEHVQATLDRCRAADDQAGLASALTNLGLLQHYLGQDELALEAHHAAMSLAHSLRDPAREAAARNNLAVTLLALGRPREVLDELQTALALARLVNAASLEVHALLNLGEAHAQLEHRGAALDAL
ncbi:MAG TPA: HD domain-containing phosphohydrolase, partial [Deinococcales bacterium]|nr:HD domain-containing phosphohydrolase [Deinococcales bacterium]